MNEKSPNEQLEHVEIIKSNSQFLRGGIADGLNNQITGSLAEDDTQLTKFHGIYQQYDRDTVVQRRKQKLEPLYSFMIRARVPGGICTPSQWLTMDDLAQNYGGGSIRLTTRQAFQLHGVLKRNLKQTIADINSCLMDTIAACGDVNRNVMCTPNPELSSIHQQVYQIATKISAHLTPQTTAYHEIWLDNKKVHSSEDNEPIYGKTYLPRKFKTVVAIPPSNDVDVFAHDLGFIAIVEHEQLLGFNVIVGGGMGASHGDLSTFPLLAQVIGFCLPNQVTEVAEQVVKIQRDYGCRTNRKHARFKYTIDDRGIDWFKAELHDRLGWNLQAEKPFQFTSSGDQFGWRENHDGSWNLTLFIENGRVIDRDQQLLRTALQQVAKLNAGDFRITPNQNLIIGNLTIEQKRQVSEILQSFAVIDNNQLSKTRQHGMACVALPTCSLAMAEAERYLPSLLEKIESIQDKHDVSNKAIIIRMTGCPNGCARPYLAELGFVGKGPGKYNMYLGGEFTGNRLNRLYRENIDEDSILKELDVIFADYANNGYEGEWFGDFVIRKGYVNAVSHGSQVHLPLEIQT